MAKVLLVVALFVLSGMCAGAAVGISIGDGKGLPSIWVPLGSALLLLGGAIAGGWLVFRVGQ